MAEQEVIKHTRKVLNTWKTKELKLWHKIKEFLFEVVIIVFAVSLSIWLHDKNERTHEQKEVKLFLLGLREDLLSDLAEMKQDKEGYILQGHAFKYILSIRLNETINKDSLKKHQAWLFNTTSLLQNNGRFEGFKASGKIGTIEDKDLQNEIMDLYQENIPSLLSATALYIEWKKRFMIFCSENTRRLTDSTNNFTSVLVQEQVYRLSNFLSNPRDIITRYDICIEKSRSIISRIENLYHLRPGKQDN